jgi:hypothetical protein
MFRRVSIALRAATVLRRSAPLALPGLSNFGLQSIRVGEDGTPYALQAVRVDDTTPSNARVKVGISTTFPLHVGPTR